MYQLDGLREPSFKVPVGLSSAWVNRILMSLASFARDRILGAIVVTLLTGCASVAPEIPRTPSHALDEPQQTSLASSFAAQLALSPGQSGVHLLVSGQDAFATRSALAESAQRTLDLQYYIVEQDATGTQLVYRALRAAQRGVRVRLLIDDMNTGLSDSDLAILALHPNVEVRLFNPFSNRGVSSLSRLLELLGSGERLNHRMHNKLWIADNAAAVMGGRNLGDSYFDATSKAAFADLDVLVVGKVVREISASFDHFWNSEWAIPIEAFVSTPVPTEERDKAMAGMAVRAEAFRRGDYAQSLRTTELGHQVRTGTLHLIPANATALSNAPDDPLTEQAAKKKGDIFPALRKIVEGAEREVIMVSPYFVPSDQGVEVLCALARRGVRVSVLTNSLASTDVPVVHAGYARYRPRLLACGVVLYELRPATDQAERADKGLSSGSSLHAKAIVVDRQAVLMGSMNLDPRSKRLNTEVALMVESAEFGQELGKVFDEATAPGQVFRVGLDEPGNPESALHWESLEAGYPIRYTTEPLASAWRRFFTPIIGALTPEDLL